MKAVIAALVLACASPALAADRVALLVGNAVYGNPGFELRNPVNDADALGAALEGLGFEVTVARNATRERMAADLETFRKAAEGAEIALFFFAGHGLQDRGANYLLGSGVSTLDPGEVAAASAQLSEVRAALVAAQPDIGVIVIDACRDNPVAAAGGLPGGLAPPEGGFGQLIAYSTDPGNVALDGAGDNSVFTEALLRQLASPGLDIRLMFGRVRQEVILATGGRQIPWVEEAVIGEHYLVPDARARVESDEIALWRSAALLDNRAGYWAYIERFPEGVFADLAARKLREGAREAPPVEIASLGPTDRDKVTNALRALGQLPQDPALAQDPTDVERALGTYADMLPGGEPLTAARLFSDAAQRTTFVAAATQQKIAAGHRILRAMALNLENARAMLAQIEVLAEKDAEARQVLASAKGDVAAMEAEYDATQRRLDTAQDYYNTLLELAIEGFPDFVRPGLAPSPGSRGVPVEDTDLIRAAGRFADHVKRGRDRPRGSFFWLQDIVSEVN